MKSAQISILVTDVGLPALGHVIELARLLEPHYAVEVVGPDLGHGISPMYRDAWPVKVLSAPGMYRWPDWPRDARRLLHACEGRVIIADKAFANTLGVALTAKRTQKKQVVLYLDEWDGAGLAALSPRERRREKLRHLHHPLETCWFDRWERRAADADLVISTTRFLQARFGGEVLDLGTDCRHFRPQPPAQTAQLKQELGLEGRNLVVFGGVARPHKGLEELVEALPPDTDLLIVGPDNEHVQALKTQTGPDRVHCTGHQSKQDMPRFLDLADVVVLPLQPSRLGQSQMPCKVFEALAMGKPVVASAVADLPRVLDGCGTLVRPGDVPAMRHAIADYLEKPLLASKHRAAARAKALREFDRPVVSARFRDLIAPLIEKAYP